MLNYEFTVEINGEWIPMALDDMLFNAANGFDDIVDAKKRIYTGVKDVNGEKIYVGDILMEQGHYVNSPRESEMEVNWKDTYSCWLRGQSTRLTPKNVQQYKARIKK